MDSSNATPLDFDLSGSAFTLDPYPTYEKLRNTEGPYWANDDGVPGGGLWFFSRYADVLAILRNPHVSSDPRHIMPSMMPSPLDTAMITRDEPDHARLRACITDAFSATGVRRLEPAIGRHIERLFKRTDGRHEIDFMAEFAVPLPTLVVADLLGIPANDRDQFVTWSHHIVIGTDPTRKQNDRKLARSAQAFFTSYFEDLIDRRADTPGDDLISTLAARKNADAVLSRDELLGMCILLVVAGHETTTHLIGNALLTLARHPEQIEYLRRHPQSMTLAVEEVLRFETPGQRSIVRVATDDIRCGDRLIHEGDQMCSLLGSANRDPHQFKSPHLFDVTRNPNSHLAFAAGPHVCIGAALARLESRLLLAAALQRWQVFTPVDSAPDWYTDTRMVRGLRTLRIAIQPS